MDEIAKVGRHMLSRAEIFKKIEELENKVSSDPDSLSFVALADLYRQNGQIDKALKVCQQGLERHPEYGDGHIVLAKICLARRRFQDAEIALEHADATGGDKRTIQKLRSVLFMQTGEYSKAQELIRRLLWLEPRNETLRKMLQATEEELIRSYEQKSRKEEISPQPSETPPDIGVQPEIMLRTEQSIEPPQKPLPVADTGAIPVSTPSVPEIVPKSALEAKKVMDQVLSSLKSIPEVTGSLVIRKDGLVVAGSVEAPSSDEILGGLYASIYDYGNLCMEKMNLGGFQKALIESTSRKISLFDMENAVLAVVSGSNVQLGFLALQIDDAVKRIRKLSF